MTQQVSMKISLHIALLFSLLLSGCSSLLSVAGNGTSGATLTPTAAAATETATATLKPTATKVPTATLTPLPTSTFTPTPTATWAVHPPDNITAPILLYHHINDDDTTNRYVVSLAAFTAQMQALRDWGYTPITLSALVEVLVHGGPLPARPVVITFDDGNEDVYQNAFPILKRFGYPATTFIVANRVGAPEFVDADQLKEMAAAGWEIGSHGWSHIDVTLDKDVLNKEVAQSRLNLEEKLGVPVKVFAYPFGTTNPEVSQKVQDYGYTAAVGLGTLNKETWGLLYYLSRQEVRREYDMAAFGKLLPWQGAP
jgi:peptidoglycan/xylan/chitin deacetylase (PgdA/CDA1 family)